MEGNFPENAEKLYGFEGLRTSISSYLLFYVFHWPESLIFGGFENPVANFDRIHGWGRFGTIIGADTH